MFKLLSESHFEPFHSISLLNLRKSKAEMSFIKKKKKLKKEKNMCLNKSHFF